MFKKFWSLTSADGEETRVALESNFRNWNLFWALTYLNHARYIFGHCHWSTTSSSGSGQDLLAIRILLCLRLRQIIIKIIWPCCNRYSNLKSILIKVSIYDRGGLASPLWHKIIYFEIRSIHSKKIIILAQRLLVGKRWDPIVGNISKINNNNWMLFEYFFNHIYTIINIYFTKQVDVCKINTLKNKRKFTIENKNCHIPTNIEE